MNVEDLREAISLLEECVTILEEESTARQKPRREIFEAARHGAMDIVLAMQGIIHDLQPAVPAPQ